jgi:hypothetical protein
MLHILNKGEARVNKNFWLRAKIICRISVALSRIFLLTLASRFIKYMQHKNDYQSFTELANQKKKKQQKNF